LIGLETLLRISQHGDGAYLFVPKDVVDVFHLMPGDRIQAKLVASYRLISGAEEEEADATRQEKVESTLVIPKQRRRRRRKPNIDSGIDIEPQESTEKEEEENGIDEFRVEGQEGLTNLRGDGIDE
jgi:antitoxin component of MazEF toxin-antitoxin module